MNVYNAQQSDVMSDCVRLERVVVVEVVEVELYAFRTFLQLLLLSPSAFVEHLVAEAYRHLAALERGYGVLRLRVIRPFSRILQYLYSVSYEQMRFYDFAAELYRQFLYLDALYLSLAVADSGEEGGVRLA
jgi:hypothetical protein